MVDNITLELYVARTNNRKSFPARKNYLYLPELNLLIGGFNIRDKEQTGLTAGLFYNLFLGYCRRNSGKKVVELNCNGDKTFADTAEGEASLSNLTEKQKRVLQANISKFKKPGLELIII